MADNDQPYARHLAEKLEIVCNLLKDDDEKNLLTGILAVAHGLEDATATNGNGTSPLPKVENAYSPLPSDRIQTILSYKDGNGPSSISYKTLEAKGDPKSPDDDPNQ